MFSLRPNLHAALIKAAPLSPGEYASWLDHPPSRAHHLDRSIALPQTSSVAERGQALLDWDLHRLSGLEIDADGPAAVGATVVIGLRIGLVWMVAPCRVTELVNTEQQIGFTYATLPGHPEVGAERFTLTKNRFEISAVSRHAFWGSRLVPPVANRMQARATDRYLAAARQLSTP